MGEVPFEARMSQKLKNHAHGGLHWLSDSTPVVECAKGS